MRLAVAFGYYFLNSPTTSITATINNNNYFLYSFLLLRSTVAYGQRIINKRDFFFCRTALEPSRETILLFNHRLFQVLV
jgi:hypothetical protein